MGKLLGIRVNLIQPHPHEPSIIPISNKFQTSYMLCYGSFKSGSFGFSHIRISLVRMRSGLRRWWSQSYTIPKNGLPLILYYHTQSKPHSSNNTLLKELVQTGHFIQTLEYFTKHWNTCNFRPDNYTFPYILKASTQLKDPLLGLLIHNIAIKSGFDSNLFVSNSLILFYGKFGKLDYISYLFDEMPQRNIVTWTAAISALLQNLEYHQAVRLFRNMLVAGIKPNSFTMATILPCFCYMEGSIQIHGFLIKHGFETDVFVLTALIDVYAKCGFIFSAEQVLNEMPERNVVSWNAMILGYNQNGESGVSLELFSKMSNSGDIQPDSFSVVTALNSCTSLTALRCGEEIHCYTYKVGLDGIVLVGNGLIDMYGKCGVLEQAAQVFYGMQETDVSSWTTLITCYGLHGKGTKAVSLFEEMKQTRSITPNSVTITAVLTACSHSGLVQDGLRYFEAMTNDFGIEPVMKHYACMVDLLGRAGFLEEALRFINKMPIQGDARLWETLLGAATIQGDRTVIGMSATSLIKLQPENAELVIQLANICANFGSWEDVAKARDMAPSRKICKNPGVSYLMNFKEVAHLNGLSL